MTSLQAQATLPWLLPWALYERAAADLRLQDGASIQDELDRMTHTRRIAGEALSLTKQSAEDLALYRRDMQEIDQAQDALKATVIREIHRFAAEGAVLGFGRRSPEAPEELIPPRYWNFLQLNFEARTAQSETFGLRFAGIRFLILQDLSPEWRRAALRELDEIDPVEIGTANTAATADTASAQEVGRDGKQDRPRAKRGRHPVYTSKPQVCGVLEQMRADPKMGLHYIDQLSPGEIEKKLRSAVQRKPLPGRTTLMQWVRDWRREQGPPIVDNNPSSAIGGK